MRSVGFLLCVALAGCGAARPPEGVEWVALRDLNDRFADADDPTNRPPLQRRAPPGMIRAVDVSPDGVDDWLIDYAVAGAPAWCGTGGCRARLYVSTDAGLVRALDRQVVSLTVLPGRVDVTVHALHCVEAAENCVVRLKWNATSGRLEGVSAADSDWAPLEPGN
ncbi:MAG: hypothetical protein KKC29_15740 [Alphaproteobacteria bacterium]|nr:hypothetical protein [Alphaproteobacteria bacterium]MBU1525042.1 hypothetical protein [Alphaproteobacteria bacterium]MBU2292544.1 hypothetical protein [Alphaproteobacteria bacterium]MBU2381428.1 hypothetical protein [Alphaproteobacteria bacterium]